MCLILGFFVSALVALYYSFSFSNHLFWLSLPLSAISIYLSKVFIFEKVYDDYTEVGSVEVKVDDVELVAETIIGKVKLEIKSGV